MRVRLAVILVAGILTGSVGCVRSGSVPGHSGSPTVVPTGSGVSGASACRLSDVKLFLAGRELGTFHDLHIWGLKSTGGTECMFRGYLDVKVLASSGRRVRVRVTESSDRALPAPSQWGRAP